MKKNKHTQNITVYHTHLGGSRCLSISQKIILPQFFFADLSEFFFQNGGSTLSFPVCETHIP